MLHHPAHVFYLTGHCWFVCVRVGINVCSCNLSFFQAWKLPAFSSAFLIFKAEFISSWLTGWWCAIRTVVGARGDVRLLFVVGPAGKWWYLHRTTRLHKRAAVLFLRHPWVLCTSDRTGTWVTVCAGRSWSSFRTDATLPWQNFVVLVIYFPPP